MKNSLCLIINSILAITLFPSFTKCLYKEDVPEIEKPHFWTACNKTEDICENYGFEYVDSYKQGLKSRSRCKDGNRVRCAAPDALPLLNSAATVLKIMSYNLFERAFYISHDGQRERSCRVPYWIVKNIPDVDVITFQEGFMGGCWHNQVTLRDLLSYYGFKYHTTTIDDTKHLENGGIFIASKWPIIETKNFVFNNSNLRTFDFMAAKGASYAKIEKKIDGVSKKYNVLATHLNAGVEFNPRALQASEIYEFVRSLAIPKDEPVLLGGDLNTDLYGVDDIATLIQSFHAKVVPITWHESLSYTMNVKTNDISVAMEENRDKTDEWLDYILYFSDYQAPKSMKMMAIAPKADKKFPVCWCEQCTVKLMTGYLYPNELRCPRTEYFTHLSDHDAVVAEFVF